MAVKKPVEPPPVRHYLAYLNTDRVRGVREALRCDEITPEQCDYVQRVRYRRDADGVHPEQEPMIARSTSLGQVAADRLRQRWSADCRSRPSASRIENGM